MIFTSERTSAKVDLWYSHFECQKLGNFMIFQENKKVGLEDGEMSFTLLFDDFTYAAIEKSRNIDCSKCQFITDDLS